jgi:hypothetical protein
MKLKNVQSGIILLTAMIALTVTACPQPEGLSSDAGLSGITVASVKATLGDAGDSWRKAAEGEVFLADAQMKSATVKANAKGEGATVYYAVAKGTEIPSFVEDSTFNFNVGDYLYAEVFSANHDKVAFYKVKVGLATPNLNSLGVNQNIGPTLVERGAPVGAAGTTPETAAASTISIGVTESSGIFTIMAQPEQATTVLRYAKQAGGTGQITFSDADNAYQGISLANDDAIYIEATGPDGETTLYYRANIIVKSDGVNGITIAGNSFTPTTTSVTTSAIFSESPVLGFANVANADALTAVGVSATENGTGAVISYGFSADGSEPEWTSAGTLANVPKKGYIGIKIASDGLPPVYYKFRISYGSTDINIDNVTIGGVAVDPIGTSGQLVITNMFGMSWASVMGGIPGTITFTAAQAGTATDVAVGIKPTNAIVKYSIAVPFFPGTILPPVWQPTGAGLFPTGVTNGTGFLLEVTAEDEITTAVYQINVTVQ